MTVNIQNNTIKRPNHFNKLPDEIKMKNIAYNLDIPDLKDLANSSYEWNDLINNTTEIWRNVADQIGINYSKEDNSKNIQDKISKIYDEANLFKIDLKEKKLINIQNIKTIKQKIDNIKAQDTLKVWNAIYSQVDVKPGLKIDLPNIWSLNTLSEITKVFDQWILDNKDKMEDDFVLNLQKLDLFYLTPSIGNLTNLAFLDLSNNKIESISENLGNLPKLVVLDLSHNKIKRIVPEAFDDQPKMYILDLHDNPELTELPKNIFDNLDELVSLSLPKNQLKEIPPSNCKPTFY